MKGDIIMAGLRYNKTTHALFVEVHLMSNEADVGPHPSFAVTLQCSQDAVPCWPLLRIHAQECKSLKSPR